MSKPRKLLFVVASLLAAMACQLPSDEITRLDGTSYSPHSIEEDVRQIMRAARLPGLQVAVIDQGRIALSRGYGVRSVESDQPIDEQTVFAALSFSKTLFAHLVLQLVSEGALDLDRPLIDYMVKPLGEYVNYTDVADDDRVGRLTARLVLSHTTGFPNWRWFTETGELTFIYQPGERFSYSGEGFQLLQLVVEELTGKNLEQLARQRIFDPLEMSRTSFVFRSDFEDNFAVDHDPYSDPVGKDRRDEAQAAGSAQTTASDYARFVITVMEGRGLGSDLQESAFSPQVRIEHVRMFGPLARTPLAGNEPSDTSWGLGWGLVETPHGRAFFHTGNDFGAANYHVAFPERRKAVILLGNSQRLENAAPALTRVLIGDVFSPFGFLGYEPYDSPRHELVRVIAERGLPSGLHYYRSAEGKGVGLWFADEWAFLHRVGRDLSGLGHHREAVDFYRKFLPQFGHREEGYDALAKALLSLGELAAARDAYRRSRSHSEEGSIRARRVDWRLEWLGAILDPRPVSKDLLVEYAGDYQERRVELRVDILYYHRRGGAASELRRLYPMSEDTFVMREVDDFRLRFHRNAAGDVDRVEGLYMNGDRDASARDPDGPS